MTKLIMGIGIPGSGKTTILKNFAEKYDYAYICPDDIRKELTGSESDQSKNNEVWTEAKKRMVEKFQDGKTVVFDATFTHAGQRKEFISFARQNGIEKIDGVFLDIPIELTKERNQMRERKVPDYALDRMNKNITDFPPEISDGFDSIFTLNEHKELVRAHMAGEQETIKKEFDKIH